MRTLPPEQLNQMDEVLERVLKRRGVTPSFLDGDQPGDIRRMAGGETALARVIDAGWSEERIMIHGDYDADGLSACALIVEALQKAGAAAAIPFIPNPKNGFGLGEAGIRFAQEMGISLIVTVDNGVAAIDAAQLARQARIDLVVTDHHPSRPDGVLPDAVAVVDRKLPGDYGQPDLAGVGVAYPLARALVGDSADDSLDLVSLGTIADVVPLTGANRWLVQAGLRQIRKGRCHPGLQALCTSARVDPRQITASDIGFSLSPAINAARRLDDPLLVFQLLTCVSVEEAWPIAAKLWALNSRRKRLTTAALDRARCQINPDAPVLVIVDPELETGLAGLVAGKLADEFHRPAIVLTLVDGQCTGSARGTENQAIHPLLESCADLLGEWGGHARAAGLTLSSANVPHLQERLASLVTAPGDKVRNDDVRTSRDGAHLFGTLVGGSSPLPMVGWGLGAAELPFCSDLVYTLERRDGQITASVLDVLPAGELISAEVMREGVRC